MTHATIGYVWDVAITRLPAAITSGDIFAALSPLRTHLDRHNPLCGHALPARPLQFNSQVDTSLHGGRNFLRPANGRTTVDACRKLFQRDHDVSPKTLKAPALLEPVHVFMKHQAVNFRTAFIPDES